MQVNSTTSTRAYFPYAPTNSHASMIVSASASNSASVGETATISQAAQELLAASKENSSPNSGGTYDFTNMSANELGKLIGDGKITGGHMILSPAQLKVMAKGVSGVDASKSEIDAANNTPVNYVQLYVNAIRENLATGLPVVGLQNILNQMEALQGGSSGISSSALSDAASKSANSGPIAITKDTREIAKLAEQFAGGIDLAWVQIPKDGTFAATYGATGAKVTPESRAAFNEQATKIAAGRAAVYQAAVAAGKSPQQTLSAMIDYMNGQSPEYLKMTNWAQVSRSLQS